MEQTAERQLSLVAMQEKEEFTQPYLSIEFKNISSHLAEAIVQVSKQVADTIRNHTAMLYQKRTHTPGLGIAPMSYIEKNYGDEITADLRKLIYRYFVIDYLYEELGNGKINMANEPRLSTVNINDDGLQYIFDLSTAPEINLREWKHFAFKSPRRKNYKDLDKQVDSFIKTHHDRSRKRHINMVEDSDWVCFSAELVNSSLQAIIPNYSNTYWLRATTETLRHPFVDSLLGKQIGERVISDQFSLIHQFSEHAHNGQAYALTVTGVSKGSFLAIDSLKHMFKLANKAAVHEKIVEVFSYRNDLSQRRTMIEEMFHLFFSKHRFEVPKHLALRKQEELLNDIKRRPDYHAYRKDVHFLKHVATLAEQQLKEEMLIDQIAANDKIKVDIKDVTYYLNVLNDDRGREFIYFRTPLEGVEDFPTPVQSSSFKLICRREKTLNYILHHLTR